MKRWVLPRAGGPWEPAWLLRPLRTQSLGDGCSRMGPLALSPQWHGVRRDAEAAHGVPGGTAEPRFPKAEALRPSARPHSRLRPGDAEPRPPLQEQPPTFQQPSPPGTKQLLLTPEQCFQNIKQYDCYRGGNI
ncbi:Hypothetical predicted protein [Marmota monax]|uniref:Uncharacterized protein n=1 Tax=Marmota monax TaxID=9995 RepID=A0A5E4CGH7_MARMO|nr:Hypothetical predicted protein [Marmota monax]